MREQMQRAGPAASSASNKAKDLRRFIQECTRVLPVVARISGGEDAAAFVRNLLKNRAAAWGGIQAPPTVKPVIPEKPTAPNKTQALKVDLTDGVTIGDFGPQQAKSWNLPERMEGALVLSVKHSSIAANHGIQPGDIILELDHHFVRNADDAVRVSKKVLGKSAAWVRLYRPWVNGNQSGGEKFFLLQANQSPGSVAGNGSPVPTVEVNATPAKASPPKVAPVSAPPKAQEVSAGATAQTANATPLGADQSEPAPEVSFSWIGALLICLCAMFIGGSDLVLFSLLAAAAGVYFYPWLTVSFTAKMCFAGLAIICPISRNS
jgi:membrane-associated protease RseP (regulator of RpoE activity)